MDRVPHNSLAGLLKASVYTRWAVLYEEDGNMAKAQKYRRIVCNP